MTIFIAGFSAKISGIAVHLDIENDNVRIVLFHSFHGVLAVRRCSHNLDVGVFFQESAGEAAHDRRIVNNQYLDVGADFGCPRGGRR